MKRAPKYKPYPKYKDSGVPWIGEIPVESDAMRLKHFAKICNGRDQKEVIDDFGAYPIFGSGGEFGKATEFLYDKPSVLLGRKGTIDKPLFIRRPFWTVDTMYYTEIDASVCPKFFYYSCLGIDFDFHRDQTTLPSMTQDRLNSVTLVKFSLVDQKSIADFLDRETGKIDRLIAKQERQIELIDEKRQALITDAVLGKIDIGTYTYSSMPTKDSAIPTIGKIPKHWKVERAKRCVAQIDDRSDNGTEELLTVSHLTGVTSRRDKNVNMFLAESLEGYKKCKPGDLIINTMWAWMGALGVARQEGIVSPSYHVYRPILPYDFQWLEMFSRTKAWVQEMTRYSKGVWSSRLRLYPDAFLAMSMPAPPLEEQKAIVEYVNVNLEKTDELKTKLTSSIELLKERRTALISAAVTGKIDVRGI